MYKKRFALEADNHNGHLVKTTGLLSYIANIIEKTSGNPALMDAISEGTLLTIQDLVHSAYAPKNPT